MESIDLGINSRIALEVDIISNVCNFSKNPSILKHLQWTGGRECGARTIEGAAETIRIESIGTARLLL
jgi:hypothetical protein